MQSALKLRPLERPCSDLAVDGRHLATVTHVIELLSLFLSGNHREMIQSHVLFSHSTPLILRYPWLRKHNPHINWAQNKITFCHSSCLQSALSAASGQTSSSSVHPKIPDLNKGPEEYHNLHQVFSKSQALSLPLHHPSDCDVELLPGAPLPSICLSPKPWRPTLAIPLQQAL